MGDRIHAGGIPRRMGRTQRQQPHAKKDRGLHRASYVAWGNGVCNRQISSGTIYSSRIRNRVGLASSRLTRNLEYKSFARGARNLTLDEKGRPEERTSSEHI